MIGIVVKSALVLGAAWAITGLMRRTSAASRHVVWCVAIGAVLALPALSALPGWKVLPDWGVTSARPLAGADAPLRRAGQAARVVTPAGSPASDSAAAVQQAPPVFEPLSVVAYVAFAWVVGAVLALVPPLLGRVMLRRFERRCSVVTDPDWLRALSRACEDLGIVHPVRLLLSQERTMPMTWGVVRARVLLPAESGLWSAQRRRIVLLHELGHIKRWDCLTHLLAQIARALYWFNPLAWAAVWRMQVERERACDDLVLRLGARGSEYAEQLLAVTAGLRSAALGAAAMAMARPSQLEGRVREILDPGRNRRTVSARHVLGAALLAAVLVVPVAAMKSAPANDSPSANGALKSAQPDPHPERWGGKPGDPLPEYLKVSNRLRQIDQAITYYAYNHDQRLPADLGAVFKYMGEARDDIGRSLSPANRARVFLSPEDEKTKNVPENPTPEWVNQNASFTYLGSADLLLSEIPAWQETAILQSDMNRGYVTNKPDTRVFVVCFLDSHTDALSRASAEWRIAQSKATLQAVKTGSRFADHVQDMWNVDKIMGAIDAYAKDHGGQLPPDLGATLAYVPGDPKRLGTPAQKGAVFVSPSAWATTKVPENPTAQWVNQNSSYTYLGAGGVRMAWIPVPDRTVLVHGELKEGLKVVGAEGREEQVFVISSPMGRTEAVPGDYARAVVEESRKVLDALKTGAPLPDYQHAMRDVHLITQAVLAYAKDHDGQLPPDLGAVLKYVPIEVLSADTPAERAKVFLSPKAERAVKLPDAPTADWINRNASYLYLGGPGIQLSQVLEKGVQVIVHGDLGEPYEIIVPGGAMRVVPQGHPVGLIIGTTPEQLTNQIAEAKKQLEAIRAGAPERK